MSVQLSDTDPLAVSLVRTIHTGDVTGLRALLIPDVATCRIGPRSLLHVATDWPGHFPSVVTTIETLVEAGADVNARFTGAHTETPLHWAASSNDVAALDALLDAGADIDAPGAVIAGDTPLADARAFGQWEAAHRLVARGASVTLTDAATLGLLDQVRSLVSGGDVNVAFWGACHGGQLECARYLLEQGADPRWVAPWEPMSPLDAARRSGASDVVRWLSEEIL